MIVKFCFQNEIHRSSNAPQSFSNLPAFITNMFKADLPAQFNLEYINLEGESVPLTEEAYEVLQASSSSKPVKIVVVDPQPAPEVKEEAPVEEKVAQPNDYEVLESNQVPENKEDYAIIQSAEVPVEEEAAPEQQDVTEEIIEKLAEDLTRMHVMPKLEGVIADEAYVKAIVSDTLREMMPLITSHVRDTFNFVPQNQASYPVESFNAEAVEHQPQKTGKLFNQANREKFNQYKEKTKQFLNKTLDKLSELPVKIPAAMDTFGQKLIGDPYVLCGEGRYPRSVVEKSYKLKEVFVEERMKDLLEFVARLPREASVIQLADLYANMKQAKEEQEKAGAPAEKIEVAQE